jgi:hypothetical protein
LLGRNFEHLIKRNLKRSMKNQVEMFLTKNPEESSVSTTDGFKRIHHAWSFWFGKYFSIFATLALIFLTAANASAASIVLAPPPGWNGFFIQAEVQAGFMEHDGAGSLVSSSSTSCLVVDYAEGSPIPSGYVFSSSPIALGFTPSALGGTGASKDIASGAMIFSYEVGSLAAASQDRLSFSFSGTTSAENAYVDFGSGLVAADAYFRASLSVLSFGPIAGEYAATFGLSALPSLFDLTQESISAITSIEGGAVSPVILATQSSGSSGVNVPLDMTEFTEYFKYEMIYSIRTPFGSDPDFTYDFTGTASVVPELGTTVLCSMGIVAVAVRRRRR